MIRHLGLKAYGKINLGLDVLGRREDGYHDVRMIMQTVGIYDKIDIYLTETPGISVETNLYYLPCNENNLVHRAADLLMKKYHIRHGVRILVKKYIPVSAGMAGGSSDAAAVLFGVNKMFDLGLSREQLMEEGVKIGADVPFCIMRGTALSEGIGEVLTPLPPVPQCRVLIAKPAAGISTKVIYEKLDRTVTEPKDRPDIDAMIRSVRERDIFGVASHMKNVLEKPAVQECPVILEIENKMKELGAVGAMMSGSGPTVFGIFTSERAAGEAYEELRYGASKVMARQVYLTNFYNTKEVSCGK